MNEPKWKIKEWILQARELTIRKGLFTEKVNDKFVELLPNDKKFLKKLMEEMNYKFSYRIFFSIPYSLRIREDSGQIHTYPTGKEANPPNLRSDAAPKGSGSSADAHLKDVVPLWTRQISSDWFDSKFRQLDKKLEKVWSKLDKYDKNNFETASEVYKDMNDSMADIPGYIKISKGCKESDISNEFAGVFRDLENYFAVLGFENDSLPVKVNLSGDIFSVKPDVQFLDLDGNVIFFMELKRHGLIKYVDGNVIKETEEMNSIMHQVLKYMGADTTDCCIISDMEICILVQLDFKYLDKNPSVEFVSSVLSSGDSKPVARVPFKYHIFRPGDTIHTFQAIICSVIYDQKLRAGSRIQIENVKRLKELIVLDGFKIKNADKKSDGSSSDSHSSHSSHTSHTSYSNNMNRTDQLPSIEEQDANTEDMSDDPNHNNQNDRWINYTEKEFFVNEGEFEILQQAGAYMNTVLKLNRKAIDRNFSHLNIPPSVSYVVIKVYDLFNAERYIEYNELDTTYDEVQDSMIHKFRTESECYKRTNRYNGARGKGRYLRVPKLYGRGACVLRKVQQTLTPTLTHGYYFILEYIEKDQNQEFNLEDARCQIAILGRLGIQHNDVYQRNIAVSGGKFNILDFSEARLDFIDVSQDTKMLERAWVEQEKRYREGEQKR